VEFVETLLDGTESPSPFTSEEVVGVGVGVAVGTVADESDGCVSLVAPDAAAPC